MIIVILKTINYYVLDLSLSSLTLIIIIIITIMIMIIIMLWVSQELACGLSEVFSTGKY